MSGKKVHFIGVGGISMSSLIKIAHKLGARVSGSDRSPSEALSELEKQGYSVYSGSRPEVAKNSDICVYTTAIKPTDPERVAAGDKAVSRADFLASVAGLFNKTVAVAGTHGKTTVSAMLSCCLAAGNAEFSAHIGGVVRNFNDSVFLSGSKIFVTEACEYKDAFLSLSPDVAVVLNAELDHGDYFYDTDSVYRSFSAFLRRVRRGGFAVLGDGVSSHMDLCANDHLTIYSYGDSFSYEPAGNEGGFYLKIKGEPDRFFQTSAKGKHNLYNAAVTAFTALKLGLSEDSVRMGIAAFLGVKRRYERMGNTQSGAAVIHDYAHHPGEIEAVMEVARGETKGRLIVVFEPHTYSRTRVLFDGFKTVLSKADVLVMLPTYSARETSDMGADSKELFCACAAPEMYAISDYNGAKTLIEKIAKGKDTVLVLGAGGIVSLAHLFRPAE